jgi:hypothetical protein
MELAVLSIVSPSGLTQKTMGNKTNGDAKANRLAC